MKLIYAGAPVFSITPLRALLDAGFCVCAVITQPDKPAGRKAVMTPTPLKAYAAERGIPVYDFARIRDNVANLRQIGADCMVTCAYGQILTQEVLQSFPMGVYNIHTSLLPRWRGASPVQHALRAGDAKTGVTIMRTDAGLDTGDILLQEETDITAQDTAESLSERLSALGGECIVRALKQVCEGCACFRKQPSEGVTLCKKIRKQECELDFARPAKELCCLIRAMNPEPLAFTTLHGKLVNLYSACVQCKRVSGECGEVVRADKTGIYVKAGEGVLQILELQQEGGKRMRAADFVNGRKIVVGDRFGGQA